MIKILIPTVVPAVAGIIAFFIKSNTWRRALLVLTASLHLVFSLYLAAIKPLKAGWIGSDSLSIIFLVTVSLMFLAAAVYSIFYLTADRHHEPENAGRYLSSTPESIYTGCLLLLLSTMTLAVTARHFALQWVSIEATTLASAPLIYYHRSSRSLEAAWKYLIICSVGIAIALMGLFFLRMTSPKASEFTVDAFVAAGSSLDKKWLSAAFIIILVGYGTKMGLAPLHTWLPDAHSEAPAPVSALLSGALLNCAFLGIMRVYQVANAGGIGVMASDLLVMFGIFSVGLATVFILRQPDFKRLLAYSSVENMGIIALGVGVGGGAVFGGLFHAVNHSLVKVALFLAAGNILARYGTRESSKVRGLASMMPATAFVWTMGLIAITGTPPFGTFISKFTILKTMTAKGLWSLSAFFMAFLVIIFAAMSYIVLKMVFTPPPADMPEKPERTLSWIMPVILLVTALAAGIYMPDIVRNHLEQASALFGGGLK